MKTKEKILAITIILLKTVVIPPAMIIEDTRKQVKRIKYWKAGNNPRNI